MSRIVSQIVTLSQHLKTLKFEPERYRPTCCPIFDPDSPISLCRCKRSCSRLPECLPPRRWYQWVIQQTLLTVLLMGDSIRKAACLVDVARRTGRRWWSWLKAQSDLFAFHLKDRFPDWGRMADFSGFWLAQVYHVRRHGGLNDQTPLARYQQDLPRIRQLGLLAPRIDEIFYHRVTRMDT